MNCCTCSAVVLKSEVIINKMCASASFKLKWRSYLASNLTKSDDILRREPAFCQPWNYHDEYREACHETIRKNRVRIVIHLGCGRDKENIFHRNGFPIDGSLTIVGVDRDLESLKDYPGKLKVLADLEHLPFHSEIFGLGASEEVFEHIAHPYIVAHEISRVLVPGGVLQFCTPSKYSYVSILAMITPLRLHRLIQVAMNPGEYRQTDVFPKYYRLNSRHDIDLCFTRAGLKCLRLFYWDGGPWMLRFHPVLVRLGVVYHRILRRFRSLSFLSNAIVGAYKKSP